MQRGMIIVRAFQGNSLAVTYCYRSPLLLYELLMVYEYPSNASTPHGTLSVQFVTQMQKMLSWVSLFSAAWFSSGGKQIIGSLGMS